MNKYSKNYIPREYNGELSNYYIEVGRACYQYEGLKDSKVDILVYSAMAYIASDQEEVNLDVDRIMKNLDVVD